MLTVLLLALSPTAAPGPEFVVTVTYYEAEPQSRNNEGRRIREFRQNLAFASPPVAYKSSMRSYGWVPRASNRRQNEVHELVHTSVEAIGSNGSGVRLAGHVEHWEDTETKRTKKLDGEYDYGSPIIIPLSAPRSERRVWAVVLVTKPPVARVDD